MLSLLTTIIGWSAAAVSPQATAATAPIAPAEAIIMADRRGVSRTPGLGASGRFVMTVAATGRTGRGIYLNSSADYRSPDNVSFYLRPVVAQMLEKKYGAPSEAWFKGRRVIVDGVVRKIAIVNTVGGRAHDLNRFAYEVDVDRVAQVVSVD
jgi:hypothetical protein